jgi:predicted acetyltransferase
VFAEPPGNVEIQPLQPAEETVLANLFELYLHDMAEWFGFDLRADGRYGYELTAGKEAYLVRVDGALAGFALAHSAAPWLDDPDSMDVDEFFIVRRFRRHGLGAQVAGWLWDRYPALWLVRVFEANLPAVPFWRSTIAAYTNQDFTEERRVIDDRPWRFFSFDSHSAHRAPDN